MSAYDHSFSPAATGRYILRMLQGGWELPRAAMQAGREHGEQQVDEIMALLNDEAPNYEDKRSLLPAVRRAIKRADEQAAHDQDRVEREDAATLGYF